MVDLLKEAFSAFPSEETRSAAMLQQATYRKTGTLAGCHKTNSVLHRPGMCRSHTSSHTHTVDRQVKAETVQADVTALQRVYEIDGR